MKSAGGARPFSGTGFVAAVENLPAGTFTSHATRRGAVIRTDGMAKMSHECMPKPAR